MAVNFVKADTFDVVSDYEASTNFIRTSDSYWPIWKKFGTCELQVMLPSGFWISWKSESRTYLTA